jgi:hypothetical protein
MAFFLTFVRVPNIPDLQSRLSSVERTVDELFTYVKGWGLNDNGLLDNPRKRTGIEAFGTRGSREISISNKRKTQSTVLTVSVCKAQVLIQHELSRSSNTPNTKRATLSSALDILRGSLKTELNENHMLKEVPRDVLEASLMPDPSLLQWVLQCKSPNSS